MKSFLNNALALWAAWIAAAGFTDPAAARDAVSQAYRIHYGSGDTDLLGMAVAPLGDVNQDGVPDYIIGMPGAANFRGAAGVYSGADGTRIRVLSGGGNMAMFGMGVASAGDVDGDGAPDIIVGAPIEFVGDDPVGAVYVFSGNSAEPIFRFQGDQYGCLMGWSVAGVGDVDGDQYPDIAASEADYQGSLGAFGGKVTIYSGADGAVIRRFINTFLPQGRLGYSLAAAGDLNGDGYGDLIAGAPGAGRAVIYSVHDGSIIRVLSGGQNAGKFGWSVANAGDVNGDGIDDQVVGSFDATAGGMNAGRAWLFNGANGALIRTFTGAANDYLGYAVAGAGDVNADGTPDILLGAQGYGASNRGHIEVYDGQSGALLQLIQGAAGWTVFGTAVCGVGDISGDGRDDYLAGQPSVHQNGGLGAAFLFTGQTNEAGLQPPVSYPSAGDNPSFLLVSDLDGDGARDSIVLNFDSNSMAIRKNLGNGVFYATPRVMAAGKWPTSAAVCDVNRDGKIDLVVTASGDNKINLFRNYGYGVLSYEGALSTGMRPSSVVAADFNADGKIDLAVANRLGASVKVYLNNGQHTLPMNQQFAAPLTYAVGTAPIQIQVARIDGNGYIDIAVINKTSATLSVLRNRGNGRFLSQRVTPLGGLPLSFVLADINRDGIRDAAYLIEGSDQVNVRLGDGTGNFGALLQFPTGLNPRALATADMNFDLHPDLITCNGGDNSVSVLLNDGAGGFLAPVRYDGGDGPVGISAVDIDRDRDPDVLTVNRTAESISVLRNLWFQ